jgi:signal transduction histidine kinase
MATCLLSRVLAVTVVALGASAVNATATPAPAPVAPAPAALPAASSAAAPAGVAAAVPTSAVRNVLLLQSFERGFRVIDRFTETFQSELASRAAVPVTISQFVVNPAGFATAPDAASIEFLRTAFVNRQKPDLVVTAGGPAATFARRYRQELFRDTPFLFTAVDTRYLEDAPLAGNETAVTVSSDYASVVEDALRVLPDTKTVMVVTGAGTLGQFWRSQLTPDLQRFGTRLTFIWSDTLSYDDMLRRTATLPADSAILYIAAGTFADGSWRSEATAFADLLKRANAPLFGVQEAHLGMGIVGGRLLATDDLGALTAAAAVRILDGESPSAIGVLRRTQGATSEYDSRQLTRWRIPESRLPPHSVVEYREPSLWRDYRQEALMAAGTLSVQSLLIAGLVYQRHARRRAETQSRTNLALAADANRRATVSAMTGSIAHELSQPLNAIQHNAQAGEMLIGANRGTPEALQEILADIRTANVRASQIIERHRTMLRNHEVDRKPIDLRSVVRESVAFVVHDTSAKQIQIDIALPAAACIVRGDRVLLQQVLVNVIMNAVDAMAATPPEKRRITVRLDVTQEAVDLSVRDAGSGLPVSVDHQVFEPFVTTKRNGIGIGLTIARAIVEAHRGTMAARNNPEGGATFTITLPWERTRAA